MRSLKRRKIFKSAVFKAPKRSRSHGGMEILMEKKRAEIEADSRGMVAKLLFYFPFARGS